MAEFRLFGSLARGEASSNSDVDILAILAEQDDARQYPPSWSTYRKDTLARLFDEGNLFAWHLYLESIPISPTHGGWFESLGTPRPYVRAKSDIRDLVGLLSTSLLELQNGTVNLCYELGLIHTALRDIAMSASWHLCDAPLFSRYSPYLLQPAIPLPREAYDVAVVARHATTRGATAPSLLEHAATALLGNPIVEWAHSLEERL